MRWYHYMALFFAGALLVNCVPHFTNGVSGRPFPSPFASPPGQVPSSPFKDSPPPILRTATIMMFAFCLKNGRFRQIQPPVEAMPIWSAARACLR